MPDAAQLGLFIVAGWLLNLTPGPDVLYIMSQSLRHGKRIGLAAALGITTGCLAHVTAAALGVSALIQGSAIAFSVLKWIGAAYLLWLGLRMILARKLIQPDNIPSAEPHATGALWRRSFLGGFWTNVLNPKVALFFLAFLPQFIAHDAKDQPLAFLLLGLLFVFNSIPISAGWALLAAWTARHQLIQRAVQWIDRIAGIMFVCFGLRLAIADQPV